MVVLDDETVSKFLTVQNGLLKPSIVDSENMRFKITEMDEKIEKKLPTTIATKLYKRRWLQLGLFLTFSATSSMHWIQFTIVGNVMSRYYGVSASAVDWTSIIFYITYLAVLFPASYLMERIGLRWSCVIGAIGTSIGSWIKFFSASPDRFVFAFVGQVIIAIVQVFVLNGSPRLAAIWFGSKEVATATAIGCLGGMTGISLLFLITPMLIKNHEKIEDIGEELSMFFLAVAVVCTVVAVTLFIFFQDEPRLPPSEARALSKMSHGIETGGFWLKIRRILTNKTFLLLWNSYGINLGFLFTVCTLLNPFYLVHFQNSEADAGRLGMLLTFSGNFGSLFFGMVLDKTKKFKLLSVLICVFSLLGQILFVTGLIMELKLLVYVAIGVIGIFGTSYGCVGFELSAEATYPEPEELSSGILNMAQNIYGMMLVLIVGTLLRTYGDIVAHAFIVGILVFGLILALLSKTELRRQNARRDIPYNPVLISEGVKSEQNRDKIANEYILK